MLKDSAAAESVCDTVPFWFFPCAILAIHKKDEQQTINQNRTYG